ncbi:MAG TPA: DUF5683 domain-containing protein [Flavitalea sp.]|nr:DUF5683 domain-containing protein [Flavitalea sp.]
MIKIFLNMMLLLFLFKGVYSQVTPDSTRVRPDSSLTIPTDTIPVFSDTTQLNDTGVVKTKSGKDSVVVKKKVHSPRRATMRSLIIPGWGQIYNKKYWKVPLVYGAIGVPAYLFTYNRKWYSKTKYALSIVANNRYTGSAAADSLAKIDPALKFLVDAKQEGSLVNYRNQFRRDMDYSILFTVLMWGLNIVDATVDGHLIGFDVGDELSMKIRPTFLPNTTTPALSFVVNFR